MPTRALLAAAQAELQRILSDTERGLAAADQLPELEYDDTTAHIPGYIGLVDRRAQEQRRLALAAAAQIVDVISALDWPAADRRRAVETWHEQVRALCAIDPPRFLAERRTHAWWDRFQQQLQQPPARAQRQGPTRVPAWVKQLRHWRDEAGLPLPKLAEALKADDSTLKSHLRGLVQTLRPQTRREYEKGFTRLLSRPVKFDT